MREDSRRRERMQINETRLQINKRRLHMSVQGQEEWSNQRRTN
jgi:hypothetical protein